MSERPGPTDADYEIAERIARAYDSYSIYGRSNVIAAAIADARHAAEQEAARLRTALDEATARAETAERERDAVIKMCIMDQSKFNGWWAFIGRNMHRIKEVDLAHCVNEAAAIYAVRCAAGLVPEKGGEQ